MGKFISDEMKQKIYKIVTQTNDRAFSLVTIFVMSIALTAIDLSFSFCRQICKSMVCFSALAVLVYNNYLVWM